ncbi:Ribosomal lysine N-methyltransferase set10 [Lecanosticta acicola]|uniref:Ribosomal lysine N-methyltransferase set10 n=1 Tax=Lecanosticta acicola TaxID=111012 RepID=A0AAI8Z8P4_9PEZI|nr:Ribosomal lysine N-methyltransferase set10 [Lecanosticta acicola]
MASASQLDDLRRWHAGAGGYLHPSISIEYNETQGVHWKTTSNVSSDERLCTVPHSLALSSLNALVDDAFPVFRNRGLPVEAIGYFFLMHEYINRERSFWRHYLETLPGPKADHRTPFWFDAEDSAYLEDTDVLHTAKSRMDAHKRNYATGVSMIEQANIDSLPYTWLVFRLMTGPEGQRQTALVDMSRASAEELDFPVLFPVLDIANHAPNARVSWQFDPGQFSMSTKEILQPGSEVLNNYGPKRNDELLLGYGFCLADNPNEKILMTLKPPPEGLQEDLLRVHPGYFTNGEWSSEKATFAIGPMVLDARAPAAMFHEFPEPLLELLVYMLRHERGLPFSFVERPLHYLTADVGRQYLPHITRMIVQSLLPKLAKLQSSTPPQPPSNQRQEQARIYRGGQIRILDSITGGLRNYLRSLLYPTEADPRGPLVVTLEGLLELLRLRGNENMVAEFLNGIGASSGTTNPEQLREAGWEDDAFVLLLCFLYSLCDMCPVLPEYLADLGQYVPSSEELEQAGSSLELVAAAANACPGSFWDDSRWSENFIAALGGQLLKYESFVMMIPHTANGGDARLVTYVHGE